MLMTSVLISAIVSTESRNTHGRIDMSRREQERAQLAAALKAAREGPKTYVTVQDYQDYSAPVAPKPEREFVCHYCGMPATTFNFFDAPVCDDCN